MAPRATYRNLWLVRLLPFLRWTHLVTPTSLRADLIAGLTGAIIVLPQGVAFAMIAGLPAEYGLYTAIVTPVIAALFGSSRHLISGPTTAISIVVFATVSRHAVPGTDEYVQMALTLTFLAGAFQLGLGLARLGTLVNFISHTVVVAFTAGAAILIATSQLKHVLGLDIPRGNSFLDTWTNVGPQLAESDLAVISVALATLAIAYVLRRYRPRLPNLLLAMLAGSLLAAGLGFYGHEIPLVGAIPAQLPPRAELSLNLDSFRQLASEAFAVALLGLIEAVSIARTIGVHSGQRIDGSQEFIGQGLSNLIGSLFSAYAGSGSFTRSGVNFQAGATTPLAAIFAAMILAAVVLTIAPLTAYLPMAATGGVILLVAYNLIDWEQITTIMRSGVEEMMIFFVTFISALMIELEFAIYAGVLLSLFLYLRRTTRPIVSTLAPNPRTRKRRFTSKITRGVNECPQMKILRVEGALYYGAVQHVADAFHVVREQETPPRAVLLIADGINFLDLTGAELLANESRYWRQRGGGLYLCGLRRNPRKFLVRTRLMRTLRISSLYDHKPTAVRSIVETLDPEVCRGCTRRVFLECLQRPGGSEAIDAEQPTGDPATA